MSKIIILSPGMIFDYKGDKAKIMAIAENYVMARKKGAFPFIISCKDLIASLS